VNNTNKCGRELNKVRDDVDKLAGEELQWAGKRMVAIGKLTTELHEEMKLLHGEMLDTLAQVQDAALSVQGFGSDLGLDPLSRGLDGFDRITGNANLKEQYEKFRTSHQQQLNKLQQQTFKLTTELGDDIGIGLGDFVQDAGTAVERFGYYMAASSGGFPEAMSGAAPVIPEGVKSHIAVGVSSLALNQILNGLQSERFAIGKSAKKPADNREYVEVRDFDAAFDPGLQCIMVVARDARVRARVAGSVQSVKVKSLRVQLVPSLTSLQRGDGTYEVWLTLRPRALQLDVANMPTRLDQALAYVLNDTALKDSLQVDLSAVMAPVQTAVSTRLEGGKVLEQSLQVSYVPGKLDYVVEPGMLTFRTTGQFVRIVHAK
jgi:hypothetical protein